jgi:glycosyltransferase involved in cell wall biosynthesis
VDRAGGLAVDGRIECQLKVAFVYPNPRADFVRAIEAGELPDTNLLGQNHLAALGIDARIVDSALRRTAMRGGMVHRVTWHLRELSLPWEVGDAEILFTPLANLLPLAARVRRGPSVVLLSYHLLATHGRYSPARRWVLEQSVRSAAGVVCISDAARIELIRRLRLRSDRVRVATLGVDATYWHSHPPAEDGYVLSVGRDLARDYATLCDAVRDLPVRTVIAAKRENVAGLRLPSNVEVRLDIPPSEVRRLYAGASCVVVPIAPARAVGTENSGTIALLESMASGRCTVVTDRPFLSDYTADGRTAVRVPAADPQALRAAIERTLAGQDLTASVGERARAAVEESFTTRHFAARLADALRAFGPSAAPPAPDTELEPVIRRSRDVDHEV